MLNDVFNVLNILLEILLYIMLYKHLMLLYLYSIQVYYNGKTENKYSPFFCAVLIIIICLSLCIWQT